MPKKTGKDFVWRDNEVELLLNIASDYKSKMAAESVDWESVKSKYTDIHQERLAALPVENNDLLKDFQHKKEQITKQIVTSKLKAVRTKYHQAVDSGRSGHGRVVSIFFELYEKEWGGGTETEQIVGGLESTDLMNVNVTDYDCHDDPLNHAQSSSPCQSGRDDHANSDDIDNDNPRCDDDENEDCNDSNQNVSATSKRNTSSMNGNKGSGKEEASTVHQQQRQLFFNKINYKNYKFLD